MTGWKHGAQYNPETQTTRFRVWAPYAESLKLIISHPSPQEHQLQRKERGYFAIELKDIGPGARYLYQLDKNDPRPDPASRSQPDGVHSPSCVLDSTFNWSDDAWFGIPLEEYVIYEFHVGTFTTEGTFEAAIKELPRLKDLGITAVEVMPIAQFPGDRNWGYDGVYLYSAQHSYGGLNSFQRFVNEAHKLDIAVVLDVVYNHFGPEGNYLSQFGPYFTDNYRTPWGSGINFDETYSDGVRDFLVGNAVFWMNDCHVDALRLDAVHAIVDSSATPFLQQLTDTVHELGRKMHKRLHVMGENDRNDPKFTLPKELGGVGADTQWSDDFHHALHAVLTGDRHGYYEDFGTVSQLAKAFTDGFIFDGCYSPHRKRYHGADSRSLEGVRFFVCSQNHDQIGNRPNGERLSMDLSFEHAKLAAIVTLTAPYIPLLFMGEESAAKSPFQYFVSHSDEHLIQAVREGRKREFKEFFARGEAPDPQSEETFLASKVTPDTSPRGLAMTQLYKKLLGLRREIRALCPVNKRQTTAIASDLTNTMAVYRGQEEGAILILHNFSKQKQTIRVPASLQGKWSVILDSEDVEYGGSGLMTSGSLTSDGELEATLKAGSAIILQHAEPVLAMPENPHKTQS